MKKKIVFDQYSRYKATSDIITTVSHNGGTILDVGSGEECILDEFLPLFRISYVDPLLSLHPERSSDMLAGDVFIKELDGQLFDYVVCIDTLEHVSSKNRNSFIERISSLAKKGVIIAAPCSDVGNALETDKWLNEVYSIAHNRNYSWLAEHFEYGLPLLSEITDKLKTLGWKTQVTQNAHTPWLRQLLGFAICALEYTELVPVVMEISEYFNENLCRFDYQEPCYRQIIFATKESSYFLEQKSIDSKSKKEAAKHWDYIQKRMIANPYVTTELSKLLTKINELQSQIVNLQLALANSQRKIIDIHQSFTFRMFRKYDNSIGKIFSMRPKKNLKDVKEVGATPKEHLSQIKKVLTNIPLKKKDVLCFSIIPWDYRYQRPQHILSKFAEKGHRVFYLTTELHPMEKPYEIKILADNIYQIKLSSPKYLDIYKDKFDELLVTQLVKSIKMLQNELKIDAFSLVMFPTWTPLVLTLKKLLGFQIIFDCLDDFNSFPNVHKERKKEEQILMMNSNLVITTASRLFKKALQVTQKTVLIPNAGEFGHFNKSNFDNILTNYRNPIIGYFGSIAEWFDDKLIEFVATRRPNITFVFIGHTYGSDIRELRKLKNVHFLGERPYLELPKYLYCFDVCLIPFKITPLTEATHPVKIYEYMASGKPVVASKLPELLPMKELCYIAENKEDFLAKLDMALNENDDELIKKRIDFASKNTWQNRFDTLYSELNKIPSLNLGNHN